MKLNNYKGLPVRQNFVIMHNALAAVLFLKIIMWHKQNKTVNTTRPNKKPKQQNLSLCKTKHSNSKTGHLLLQMFLPFYYHTTLLESAVYPVVCTLLILVQCVLKTSMFDAPVILGTVIVGFNVVNKDYWSVFAWRVYYSELQSYMHSNMLQWQAGVYCSRLVLNIPVNLIYIHWNKPRTTIYNM